MSTPHPYTRKRNDQWKIYANEEIKQKAELSDGNKWSISRQDKIFSYWTTMKMTAGSSSKTVTNY